MYEQIKQFLKFKKEYYILLITNGTLSPVRITCIQKLITFICAILDSEWRGKMHCIYYNIFFSVCHQHLG